MAVKTETRYMAFVYVPRVMAKEDFAEYISVERQAGSYSPATTCSESASFTGTSECNTKIRFRPPLRLAS